MFATMNEHMFRRPYGVRTGKIIEVGELKIVKTEKEDLPVLPVVVSLYGENVKCNLYRDLAKRLSETPEKLIDARLTMMETLTVTAKDNKLVYDYSYSPDVLELSKDERSA